MTKKLILVCFLTLAFYTNDINAQLLNIRIGSEALVEEAVKEAMFVVESTYYIENQETGQKYGRGGKPYFNLQKTLACKGGNGFIMDSSILKPWANDPQFDKYRNDKKYKPVLNDTLVVKSISGSSCQKLPVDGKRIFVSDSALVSIEPAEKSDGLSFSADSTGLNWIVWIKADNNGSDNENYSYSVVKKAIDFWKKPRAIVECPDSKSEYLGGIYVTAKAISVGVVDFSLTGFLFKDNRIWFVAPIGDNTFESRPAQEESKAPVVEEGTDGTDDTLTPLTDKKSKSKKKKKR